jgi:hypothetical protein
MIVLSLTCQNGHAFEGWFASRAAFDEQRQRHLVQCALCESVSIHALPSGPRVLRHAGTRDVVSESPSTSPSTSPSAAIQNASVPADTATTLMQAMAALKQLASLADDVGTRFPEEARRIHYEETAPRTIRGKATAEETAELIDEGIMVLPVPGPIKGEMH